MTDAILQRHLDARGSTERNPEQILPVQYAELLRRRDELLPELRLMGAVLQHALRTFCQYAGVPGGRAARLFHEAADWFGSPDVAWPFAFENVCDALDLDPAWIRGLLARWHRTHAAHGGRAIRIPAVRRVGGGRHAVRGEVRGLAGCPGGDGDARSGAARTTPARPPRPRRRLVGTRGRHRRRSRLRPPASAPSRRPAAPARRPRPPA